MSTIINFFEQLPGLLWDGLTWILDFIGSAISWMLYTIYDGILIVIYSFTAAIDFSSVMFNAAAEYSSMPTQLIWFINEVGLPQALTYLAGAIVIRMLLNLIPAALTRV